jgi:hypothetical protein
LPVWVRAAAFIAKSGRVLLYGLCFTIAFHVRVVLYEEPRLLRSFGSVRGVSLASSAVASAVLTSGVRLA